MRISDISAAKRLKIKLMAKNAKNSFTVDEYIALQETTNPLEFLAAPYGEHAANGDKIFVRASQETADYIFDLLNSQHQKIFYNLFVVEAVETDYIELQSYIFETITWYETPITIQVPSKLVEIIPLDKLRQMFVWDGLGRPAVFCLNYNSKKKNRTELRFLSKNVYLHAQNTPRGIIVTSERPTSQKKDIYGNLMINLYCSPEINFVIDNGLSGMGDKAFMELMNKIALPTSYLDRWLAYEELSKQVLQQEAEAFGQYKYSSFLKQTELAETIYTFQVGESIDKSYIGTSVAVVVGESDESSNERQRPYEVGKITRVMLNTIVTTAVASDRLEEIPESGLVVLSTHGDEMIAKRRAKAQQRIMQHDSPIRYLSALVEVGVSEYSPAWDSNKPVTQELERNFKKSRDLNEKQKMALEMAINTPDIALIQGPPGTGKTTVIKAIQERFREIFEAEENRKQKMDPDYYMQTPRILISSFQNEAVDNAVAQPLPGDMPANRRARRKDIQEQYSNTLQTWYEELNKALSASSNNAIVSSYCDERRHLSDMYFAYRKNGEHFDDAVKLIEEYMKLGAERLPQQIRKTASHYIDAYSQENSIQDSMDKDPLAELLLIQRTTKEGYIDDGETNLGRLLAYLRNHKGERVSDSDIDIVQDMYMEDEPDGDIFDRYVRLIEQLKEKYCVEEKHIDVRDPQALDKFLVELRNAYSDGFIKATSDIDAQKAEIVQEFLFRLEEEFDTLVDKYSMTTAATCQAALNMRSVSDEVFDLVIIDEAARANPLDLLIPMSMGKKIILVGDHRQLPHMLEPDVVKELQKQPEFHDMTELEVSLFEHLFEIFSKSMPRAKAILLEQQYRMHPAICQFVSEAFYKGALKPGVSAEDRSSPVLINQGKPLVFINVPKTEGLEIGGGEASRKRPAEVDAVMQEAKNILSIEKDPKVKIGVITFYSAQATELISEKDRLLDEEEKQRVEIGTVDAFQGKEYDYVILSCVRSNEEDDEQKSVGFLVKPNRICVAFSRGRKQLIACGDAETLSKVDYFRKLIDVCKHDKEGLYREH